MTDFTYQEIFQKGEDTTEYRLLTREHVSTSEFSGTSMLEIDAEGLTFLAEQAFKDVSHLLRPSHLKKVAAILEDVEASDNDRLVAIEMLQNAVIAAEGEFQAAEKLSLAAEIIDKHPSALQLRYLQTLMEIVAENNSTTIFPIPIDLFKPFIETYNKQIVDAAKSNE